MQAWTDVHGFLCDLRKGSDGRLVTKWLIDYLSRPWLFDDVTEHVFALLSALHDFHHLCYVLSDRVWMSGMQMRSARTFLGRFFVAYSMAAQLCNARGMLFFNITPKFHYMLHIEHDLRLSMGYSWGLNPACFATQMDEDYMGVSSRFSRAAHPLGAARRTAQRWLMYSWSKWKSHQFHLWSAARALTEKTWKAECWLSEAGQPSAVFVCAVSVFEASLSICCAGSLRKVVIALMH